MILSFVRALISAFKARRELVPADELNRRHTVANTDTKLLIYGLFQKGRVLLNVDSWPRTNIGKAQVVLTGEGNGRVAQNRIV